MPIEIRELVIKATITQDDSGNAKQTGAGDKMRNIPSESEEIIKTCVEKVLEILKDRNDR